MEYRNKLSLLLSAGLLSLTLVACGGGSSDDGGSTDGGADDMDAADDTNNNGNGGSAASFNLTTQYNTGFVAATGQQVNVGLGGGFSPPRQTYTVNTADNIVTDGLTANNVPDVYYDELGRATEVRDGPSSTPYVVTYNANGTIASVSRTRTSSNSGVVTTDETVFSYDGDRLTGRNTTRTRDGESFPYGDVSYTYNASGALAAATVNRASLGFLIVEEYTFQTDSLGRVTEVSELDDEDGSVETRHVLTYDADNNVIRHDIFAFNGQQILYRDYTYTASPEPAANLPGALMSLNPVFLPEDDLFIL